MASDRVSLAKEIIGCIEAFGGRVRCWEGRVEVAHTEDVPDHLLSALRDEDSAAVASYLSARAVTRRAAALRYAEAAAADADLEVVPPGWMAVKL